MTCDNVSPRRMGGGYFSKIDLEGYLAEQWPKIPLKDFKIRVSRWAKNDLAQKRHAKS